MAFDTAAGPPTFISDQTPLPHRADVKQAGLIWISLDWTKTIASKVPAAHPAIVA